MRDEAADKARGLRGVEPIGGGRVREAAMRRGGGVGRGIVAVRESLLNRLGDGDGVGILDVGGRGAVHVKEVVDERARACAARGGGLGRHRRRWVQGDAECGLEAAHWVAVLDGLQPRARGR